MKEMFESGETLGLYAQIDLCYYGIEKIYEGTKAPRSPIERMVDATTGYDKYLTKEAIKNTIDLLKIIIKCKKKIEADFSGDAKFLDSLMLVRKIEKQNSKL